MNEDTIAGASMLPDSIEDAIYAVLHPRTVSTVPEHLELRAAISQALANARDEALEKACEVVHRATFADGKIQMDGEDLEGEIRGAYLAAAHPEGKHE